MYFLRTTLNVLLCAFLIPMVGTIVKADEPGNRDGLGQFKPTLPKVTDKSSSPLKAELQFDFERKAVEVTWKYTGEGKHADLDDPEAKREILIEKHADLSTGRRNKASWTGTFNLRSTAILTVAALGGGFYFYRSALQNKDTNFNIKAESVTYLFMWLMATTCATAGCNIVSDRLLDGANKIDEKEKLLFDAMNGRNGVGLVETVQQHHVLTTTK